MKKIKKYFYKVMHVRVDASGCKRRGRLARLGLMRGGDEVSVQGLFGTIPYVMNLVVLDCYEVVRTNISNGEPIRKEAFLNGLTNTHLSIIEVSWFFAFDSTIIL